MAKHDLMQPEDIVRCHGNILETLVHRVQRVTMARNYLPIACARRHLLTHKLSQARVHSTNALDLIGGLHTLDLRDLDQLLNIGRLFTQIQHLLSLLFMDLRKVTDDLITPCIFFQKAVIKSPYFLYLISNPTNNIIFDENIQVLYGYIILNECLILHRF